MNNLQRCFNLLRENEASIYSEVCCVLVKLCNNVIKNPNDLKYRKVRLSNPTVIAKLLPAVGAMECLFEIGFVEQDDHLLLPENASLSNLQEFRRLLSEPQTQKVEGVQPAVERPDPLNRINNSQEVAQPRAPAAQSMTSEIRRNGSFSAQESTFFQQIEKYFSDVLKYENEKLQEKARAVVPLIDLRISAMEKMRLIQKDVKATGDSKSVEDISMEDLLLAEVLKWFKEKFFKWMDNPECTKCSEKCSFQKVIPSKNAGVSRIEIHRCETCANTVEFPRYSDPTFLLRTRQGRCGEWANTFALICRSLGYDTRFVWDYTDHVWVEIWSVAANRWIHADPCENVMDRPLIYEKGWGKKLSYIFAFSKDEIQDVTWRYTADQKTLMKRRNLCSETRLLAFLTSLTNTRRRTSCSIPRQQYLIRRSLIELVELITYHFGNENRDKSNTDNYEGRTSGSLAWRLARHETKVDSSSSYVWRIPADIASVDFSYTASSDEYILTDSSKRILQKQMGWEKGIHEVSGGMFRKVENDWKMVYLARSPDNECGKIEWSFELSDSSCEIDEVNFRAITAVFSNASIEWKIQGFYKNGKTRVMSVINAEQFKTDQLRGAWKISLSAVLSGGDKDLAWQHAQLFRQSLDATDNSMVVNITVRKIN
ncbi:peptide-N(4)-(N-acetyl-beta-glucosaminyl)asparagine amidase [Athalia rosae]|uniref:peptide-N(4)-(N-acetyl-beta- glucosaminyl)asparagine amidase n=1 Tax=Athalia rosae TaxID=37344 RepID=UPI002033E31B|nr:peptide-N(4)-(N-acetyl-beta-glucosaminyl)asparagine amidase [Athalia rosae]XP_020710561.2 peptide-N(4)-(N-acetyl-beta-glucosaminyl)asparagine amidase [Athalia rosae]